MFHILIAEDDKHTGELMKAILKANGYQPHLASNGMEALSIIDKRHIDLILTDIMMPVMDGYELTQRLRDNNYEIPILMITARQLPEDKHRGFIVGTDDYITKPIDEEEMLLRIKALLRRAKIVCDRQITIGPVTLDYDSLTVQREESLTTLPPREFYLIYKLLSYPGKIFTRVQLMDEIWGMDSESTDNTVDVHIHRLRKKFRDYPEFSIETVRGLGYRAVKNL
ncbi:response regulator transcription factor [Lachnospiraceae bacterium 62-35]